MNFKMIKRDIFENREKEILIKEVNCRETFQARFIA